MTFVARAGRADDYPTFLRLFPELGVEDPVPSAEAWAANMLPRILVLDDGDAPVGYAYWLIYGSSAQVGHLVVDPGVRGRGAGRALLEAIRARAREAPCTRWSLNVKQDNDAALRLYARLGFAIEHESWAMETEWSRLELPSAEPPEGAPFLPTAADDTHLAAVLDVDAGRIAALRARDGLVLLALRERGEPVAFAAFDPALPRVFPVRLSRLQLARPLFDALRPHAREDRLVVVVEGDRALHGALVASGARLIHALYGMGGSLA